MNDTIPVIIATIQWPAKCAATATTSQIHQVRMRWRTRSQRSRRPNRFGLGREGDKRYSCSFGTRGLSQRRDSLGVLRADDPDGFDPAVDTSVPCLILTGGHVPVPVRS